MNLLPNLSARQAVPLSILLLLFCLLAFPRDSRSADLFSEPEELSTPFLTFDPAINPSSSFGQPVLRILYTASTWGETDPCPTCRTALGGLARRATLFNRHQESSTPAIRIAGPGEFAPDYPHGPSTGGVSPSGQAARISLEAYNALAYDAGWLSENAAAWFSAQTGALPRGFTVVRDKPEVIMVNSSAGMVGIVLFPAGSSDKGHPSPEQLEATVNAGKGLQGKAVAIIGVSPWGYQAEKTALPHLEGVFHCLLGAGDGMPFAKNVSSSTPSILWARPDIRGRAVIDINCLELPPSFSSGERSQWLEGTTFRSELIYLDPDLVQNSDMEAILNK